MIEDEIKSKINPFVNSEVVSVISITTRILILRGIKGDGNREVDFLLFFRGVGSVNLVQIPKKPTLRKSLNHARGVDVGRSPSHSVLVRLILGVS